MKNQASLKSDLNKLTINQTGLMQLAKDMTVISAQNHLFQETVKSIQEGTTKLISESDVNKQHILLLEQRIDILAEQQSKANIPPANPSLEDKAPELEQGKSNKDSSPVLKRDVKDSQIIK